jgi:16S rRNA (cytidine1402-2'-O)-methyltransferase
MNGKLYIVPMPIGNIEDITIRSLNTLKEVDLILAEDTREFLKFANFYHIKTKVESYYDFVEDKKIPLILNLLQNNKNIALVSDQGTPILSDPGFKLVNSYKKLLNNQINNKIIVLPGASSILLSAIYSNFQSRFLFYGFTETKKELYNLIHVNFPIIFFSTNHKMESFLNDLFDVFGKIPFVICKELTKPHESFFYGFLGEKTDFIFSGQMTIIIHNSAENNFLPLLNILKQNNLSKRDSIAILSSYFNISKNTLYDFV